MLYNFFELGILLGTLCSSLLQTSTWQLTCKLSVTLMLPAFSPSCRCARVNAGWHSSVHSAVQLNWDVSTHVFRGALIKILDGSAHWPQLFLLKFFCVKLMVLIKVLSFRNGSEQRDVYTGLLSGKPILPALNLFGFVWGQL